MIDIEVCLDSDDMAKLKQNVAACFDNGAARIELCRDLSTGGLTPTPIAISAARKAFKDRPGLLVMIRPRAGDFVYNRKELSLMIEQIELAANLGANGVVFGVLNTDSTIDVNALQLLMPHCQKLNLKVTFHRAFDQSNDTAKSLATLIKHGVHRILTNGTPWGANQGALDGIPTLSQTLNWANNAIEIVVGGGVTPDNIDQLHQHLHITATKLSFHANSGVMQNGVVVPQKLTEMIESVS